MVILQKADKWQERERLSLLAFLGTVDIGVHIVHLSCCPDGLVVKLHEIMGNSKPWNIIRFISFVWQAMLVCKP